MIKSEMIATSSGKQFHSIVLLGRNEFAILVGNCKHLFECRYKDKVGVKYQCLLGGELFYMHRTLLIYCMRAPAKIGKHVEYIVIR